MQTEQNNKPNNAKMGRFEAGSQAKAGEFKVIDRTLAGKPQTNQNPQQSGKGGMGVRGPVVQGQPK